MNKIICRMKNYIQPFEKKLALRELQALSRTSPIPYNSSNSDQDIYIIDSNISFEFLQERLTYWEELNIPNNLTEYTRQVFKEATVNAAKNGNGQKILQLKFPFREEIPIPNRRVLRYGPHGIHEYRGKFFPQLVRSLLNIAGINERSIILDTMCGSGTTPLEAVLLGCKAFGMDMNPLSVLISKAKCEITNVTEGKLLEESEKLKHQIIRAKKRNQMRWFEQLPESSQKYLMRWFCIDSLIEMDIIISHINNYANSKFKNFFKVCLSNILRKISYQKIDDLRVRRDEYSKTQTSVLEEFINELQRSVKLVVAFLYENKNLKVGEAEIFKGDATKSDKIINKIIGKVDAIVTSPPYATALPYLDTDRLSLYYLNLIPRSEHRKLDLKMIGNREISNGLRKEYFSYYETKKHSLPKEVTRTIDLINSLNKNTEVGFRRQNLPALLANYFFSMRKVFQTYLNLLKPDSPAYVVVGNNHTFAGGERIDITTDQLLAQIGESVGLKIEDTIPMEMLASRDIFKKNSSSAETIIVFKNAQ